MHIKALWLLVNLLYKESLLTEISKGSFDPYKGYVLAKPGD
jgi:hypothetical protein